MYTKFYNLRERPFNLTPDSHFLYLSSQHREALGHLLYGIRERKGFILVSGEVGTGKTTLCRALITEIEGEAEVGFILNSFLSADELLKTINEDLSCHRGAVSRKELVDELNRFLLAEHEAGRNVVVLIDECQNLALPVLEQLRMLSNLETEKEKLLQIVLVGQPELRAMLEIPELRQLAQRITVTYHLKPLTRQETTRYIRYRLAIASGGAETDSVQFTGPALKRIYRYSEGLPRKINIVCDRALLIGYVRGSRKITESIVRNALEEIQSHPKTRQPRRRNGMASRGPWIAAAAAFAALAAAGMYYAARRSPAPVPRTTAPQEMSVPPEETGRDIPGIITDAPRAADAGAPPSIPTPRETPAPPVPPEAPAPVVPAVTATREAGAAALLASFWGRTDLKPESFGDTRNLHALAVRCGMKSVSCWGGLDFIRRVNLPCIISLRGAEGEEPVRAVLAHIRDGRAVLVLPGGEKQQRTGRELQAAMCGRAVYFYPSEIALPHACAPGMRGPEVRAIQQELRAAGVLRGDEEGWYGPETAAAVGRFQERHGLSVDGVAGTGEWMLLKSLGAGEGVPRLVPGAPRG